MGFDTFGHSITLLIHPLYINCTCENCDFLKVYSINDDFQDQINISLRIYLISVKLYLPL